MRKGIVYALVNPESKKTLYVGSSLNSAESRYRFHLKEKEFDCKPELVIIQEDISEDRLWETELSYIMLHKSLGAKLLNKSTHPRPVITRRSAEETLSGLTIFDGEHKSGLPIFYKKEPVMLEMGCPFEHELRVLRKEMRRDLSRMGKKDNNLYAERIRETHSTLNELLVL